MSLIKSLFLGSFFSSKYSTSHRFLTTMHCRDILLVGLGNYTHPQTRHSIGLMVLDSLALSLKLSWEYNKSWQGYVARTRFVIREPLSSLDNNEIQDYKSTEITLHLLKPRLLMNLSGKSVARAVQDLKLNPATSLYIVHDDLEHVPSTVTLKQSGSANGHNGVKSIISCLKTDTFNRIRVGIGRPADRDPEIVAKYVLDKVPTAELSSIESLISPTVLKVVKGQDIAKRKGNEGKKSSKKERKEMKAWGIENDDSER